MKASVIILFTTITALLFTAACQTHKRQPERRFKPPPLAEVEEWWNWYWRVIEAERREAEQEISLSTAPITPPVPQRLPPKRIRNLYGHWECDPRWDAPDHPNMAVIEFTPDGSFCVNWQDGEESGDWIVRANRLELYRVENREEPDFRFFVMCESNVWYLVNAEAERGMTPLKKITPPTNSESRPRKTK